MASGVLRRLGRGLLWGVPGYVAGAFGGGWLVSVFSTNTHDRSMEAAMTGAFFFGPFAALIGFAIGALRSPGAKEGS